MVHKHYEKSYDTLNRFISYYTQINLILKTNAKKILEIGVGNKTVYDYLKRRDYDITTCDYDEKLSPDIVSDIRNLPFKANTFDLISACEILEHIPYSDFKRVLEDLHKITKKYIIISVPYPRVYFGASLRFPLIKQVLNKESIEINLGFNFPFKNKPGEHFWEIGRRGYSIRKIRNDINKHFKIIIEKRGLPHPVHYFFILEKISHK